MALVGTTLSAASASPSVPPENAKFPTATEDTTGSLAPGLDSDIVGSAYTDQDGQFHWTNGVAGYERTDTGVSTNSTFTNTDMGAVSLGQKDGTTQSNKPSSFYNTPGTLCYRLNDRKNAKGKRILPSPYNDDHCDTVGTWVDPSTKTWYAVINDEYIFDPLNQDAKPVPDRIATASHSNRLLVATSTDKGKSWHIEGAAVTPPMEPKNHLRPSDYPGSTWAFGVSGVRFWVDNTSGYFYMSYNYQVRLKSAPFTSVVQWNAVARSPISAKMAPGSWNKFDNGNWKQPGIGGFEGAVNTPRGLTPKYTPAKDLVTWKGSGADGSELSYRNHLVTKDSPQFSFSDAVGSKYTADYATGTITDADGKTVDKVEFQDPALDMTTRVQSVEVDGKKTLKISQISAEGVVNTSTVGSNYTVYTDDKTGRIFLPKPLDEWALSYNTVSQRYQAFGYDGYIYQNDDLSKMNNWTPVGYAPLSNPAYQSTLDYGSLTNQNITTRSFLAVNDLDSSITRVTPTPHNAQQPLFLQERLPKDTAGNDVSTSGVYQLNVGGKKLSDGSKNTQWRVVPVKDSFQTAYNTGVYKIENMQTGQYLTIAGDNVEAKRAWGATATTGAEEKNYDPKGNGGYGSGGGADQWYLLPQTNAEPAVLGPNSGAKKVDGADDTDVNGSTHYVLVSRNSNLALTLGDDGKFHLQPISLRQKAQFAKVIRKK